MTHSHDNDDHHHPKRTPTPTNVVFLSFTRDSRRSTTDTNAMAALAETLRAKETPVEDTRARLDMSRSRTVSSHRR
jgi:hypothetical protein